MDKIMEKIVYPTQLALRPARNPRTNALQKAGCGMHENGSMRAGFVRAAST